MESAFNYAGERKAINHFILRGCSNLFRKPNQVNLAIVVLGTQTKARVNKVAMKYQLTLKRR